MNYSLGIIFILISALCFSLTNIFAKKAQIRNILDPETGHIITIMTNLVLNGGILAVLFICRGIPDIPRNAVFSFIAAGLLNTMLGRKLIFKSVEYIGPPRAGGFKVVTPIFSFSIGIFLLHEKLNVYSLIGIFICLSGIFILTADTISREKKKNKTLGITAPASPETTKGLLFGLFAALTMGGGNIFRKTGMTLLPDPFIAGTIGALSALTLSTTLLFTPNQVRKTSYLKLISAVKGFNKTHYLTAGVFSTLAIFFVFLSLDLIPVSIATPVGTAETILTAILGRALIKEQEALSVAFYSAAALIIIGITFIFIS